MVDKEKCLTKVGYWYKEESVRKSGTYQSLPSKLGSKESKLEKCTKSPELRTGAKRPGVE
jgi:hypothetical protein